MTEKDHYKYGLDRKIDPSIPMLRARIRELEATLREARKWIGDGEFSDGLHRDRWTPMYATVVDLVDAALRVSEPK